jgi:hexosaminidase
MSLHIEPAILPQPRSIHQDEGSFLFTRDTSIVTDQQTHELGIMLAGWLALALDFVPSVVAKTAITHSTIMLSLTSNLHHLGNEGYTLIVTPLQITVSSAYPAGLFYGLQTLRQLFPTDIFSPTPVSRSWSIPAVTIEDAPSFQWRGLLLDTARHFIPKSEILKIIDLLALHKMNILHLHLTDDQGWRIEIKKYPRLTEIGSHRKETVVGHARYPQGYNGTPHAGFYTQDELREIVAYAASRFITVVPEIEIPGHAQAAVASYPEFGCTDEPVEVGTTWGIHPYLYSPTEQSLEFLQDVLTEVMDIFPGPFIHIGGDEARKDQWQNSAQVQARIKALGLQDEEQLQSWFLTQIGTFLAQHGRRFIGWDEILDGGIPSGAIVMSWQGIQGGTLAAQSNHDVVMTPQNHIYFDHYQSNDPTEPLAIGGYTPLSSVYSYHPIPPSLTPEQSHHILGAQCNIWTEYISTTDYLEYMLFPRLIALAEIVWTPQTHLDFANFCQRLAIHEARLTYLNVNFRPVALVPQETQFPPRKKRV